MADQITRVVHLKKEPYDILIGRPSKYGNPFVIGRDGTRDQVIGNYESWIRSNPALMAQVHELKGKVLGCWCKPNACHGDVLIKIIHEQGLQGTINC